MVRVGPKSMGDLRRCGQFPHVWDNLLLLMRVLVKALFVLAALASVVLLPVRDAYAYIDPGTGSYVLQMIIAGIVGAAVTVKVFFHRIRAKLSFGARKKRSPPDETPPRPEDE